MCSRTYTKEELVKRPDTVDPSQLETYLSDEEFAQVFSMTREAFYLQNAWKQTEQKKNAGLY